MLLCGWSPLAPGIAAVALYIYSAALGYLAGPGTFFACITALASLL